MTGSLQKQKGRYFAVLNIKDSFGKAKTKWVALNLPTSTPKKKVRERFNEIIQDYSYLDTIVDSNVFFTDYAKRWLQIKKAKCKICDITYEGYENILLNHILPYFEKSHLMVQEITPYVIEEYYDYVMHNKGLSSKTIRGHQSVFSGILSLAEKDNIVPYNVANSVDLPPLSKSNIKFYDCDEVKEVFKTLKNERLYPLYFTVVYYGLRRSEVLALKWKDIDWKHNKIHVQRTLSRMNSTICREGNKNNSSNRYYPILGEMRNILQRLYADKLFYKKLLGDNYHDTGYIFTKKNGDVISPNTASSMWSKLLKKYNLKHIRLHDLRHSCASLLINYGFQLKDIADWLGHSNISTTANIYGHLFDAKKKNIAEHFSQFFVE